MKYKDEQMVKYYNDDGNSVRKIADAMGKSKSATHRATKKELAEPMDQEVIGDGCYSTSAETGELLTDDLDYELELTNTDSRGNMDKIESGYPNIYYNERTKQWELWLSGKKIWRHTKLTEVCRVRLSKGNLADKDRILLESVVNSSREVQDALNEIPM